MRGHPEPERVLDEGSAFSAAVGDFLTGEVIDPLPADIRDLLFDASVTNRLGIAKADDPLEVERQLMGVIPRERWTRTTDLMIFHGRKICIARRPLCGECPVFALCRWPYRQAYAMGETPKPPRPARRGPRKRGASR